MQAPTSRVRSLFNGKSSRSVERSDDAGETTTMSSSELEDTVREVVEETLDEALNDRDASETSDGESTGDTESGSTSESTSDSTSESTDEQSDGGSSRLRSPLTLLALVGTLGAVAYLKRRRRSE